MKIFRKSIFATSSIKKDDIIKIHNITFKRPGDGIAPSEYEKFLGKVVTRDINKDDKITYRDTE